MCIRPMMCIVIQVIIWYVVEVVFTMFRLDPRVSRFSFYSTTGFPLCLIGWTWWRSWMWASVLASELNSQLSLPLLYDWCGSDQPWARWDKESETLFCWKETPLITFYTWWHISVIYTRRIKRAPMCASIQSINLNQIKSCGRLTLSLFSKSLSLSLDY